MKKPLYNRKKELIDSMDLAYDEINRLRRELENSKQAKQILMANKLREASLANKEKKRLRERVRELEEMPKCDGNIFCAKKQRKSESNF